LLPDNIQDLGVRVHVKLFGERFRSILLYLGMTYRPDEAVLAEYRGPHTETVKGLPELEAYYARAEDYDGRRQDVPFEDVVVYYQPVAKPAEHRENRRARAGGYDDRLRLDPRMAADV